jgi:hypothetical protein
LARKVDAGRTEILGFAGAELMSWMSDLISPLSFHQLKLAYWFVSIPEVDRPGFTYVECRGFRLEWLDSPHSGELSILSIFNPRSMEKGLCLSPPQAESFRYELQRQIGVEGQSKGATDAQYKALERIRESSRTIVKSET